MKKDIYVVNKYCDDKHDDTKLFTDKETVDKYMKKNPLCTMVDMVPLCGDMIINDTVYAIVVTVCGDEITGAFTTIEAASAFLEYKFAPSYIRKMKINMEG